MAKLGSPVVRVALLVLPSLIVLLSVTITASIAIVVQERSIRDATAERVYEVASSLAELREVRTTLESAVDAGDATDYADAADLAEATASLQPLADLVERAAGVYYVVVTDDEGVRITHPLPAERGELVVTTNASVLAGEEFLGTETGPSGPSFRAKVPVRGDGDRVIGMVAVGVLESSISARRDEAMGDLLSWTAGALLVGTLASAVLAVAIGRRFRRLDEVAAGYEAMRGTASALREQSHEFSTRLHVIHGLISQGDTRETLDYIDRMVPVLTVGTDDRAPATPALVSATVEAVRAELAVLGARLDVSADVSVEIDEGILLVLANLCRNAGEAGASRVRCTLRQDAGRLRGTVDDDGPGIDPRDVEKMFARGYSSKADPSGFGRGLGLDLVRRTVLARGGTIELGTSELGGVRFTFETAVAP